MKTKTLVLRAAVIASRCIRRHSGENPVLVGDTLATIHLKKEHEPDDIDFVVNDLDSAAQALENSGFAYRRGRFDLSGVYVDNGLDLNQGPLKIGREAILPVGYTPSGLDVFATIDFHPLMILSATDTIKQQIYKLNRYGESADREFLEQAIHDNVFDHESVRRWLANENAPPEFVDQVFRHATQKAAQWTL